MTRRVACANDREPSKPVYSSAVRWSIGFALWLVSLTAGRDASAAACCTSATAFGVGRLLLWEDFAVGVMATHSRILGQYDAAGGLRMHPPEYAEGLSQVMPWGIVRVHPRIQLQAWIPLLLNDRRSDGQSQTVGGLGDIGAGARFEFLGIGEIRRFPSVAITMGMLAPTGRRVEETRAPLFAGTTGRGAWVGSAALELEYAYLPWFVRVDVGVATALPFQRADTGQRQLYAPTMRAGLAFGREVVPDTVVLAASLTSEWDGALRLDGKVIDGSESHALGASVSVSWRFDPHFTAVTSLSNSAWMDGFGKNRDGRVGLTVGLRYGHF